MAVARELTPPTSTIEDWKAPTREVWENRFEIIVSRECQLVEEICRLAEREYPGDSSIEDILKRVQDKRPLQVSDRLVPEGLDLPTLYQIAARLGICMVPSPVDVKGKWQWADYLPSTSTQLEVMRLPRGQMGKNIQTGKDWIGWPVVHYETKGWSCNGYPLMTLEQALYHFLRWEMEKEFYLPELRQSGSLWGNGSILCYAPESSKHLPILSHWENDGLRISRWPQDKTWQGGGLPRNAVSP